MVTIECSSSQMKTDTFTIVSGGGGDDDGGDTLVAIRGSGYTLL